MKTKTLAMGLMKLIFDNKDVPIVLRDVQKDGGDYHIDHVDYQNGSFNIWFNSKQTIKK